MLSGGERALTAVALLFAMLEVRPVPFCVLDEVDAALDEANIGRFADALRSLADGTQFIVITHNRGTIEAADALYGVTVGDDSVSRVISLRLDEAQALAARDRDRTALAAVGFAACPSGDAVTTKRRPNAKSTSRSIPTSSTRHGSPIRPTSTTRPTRPMLRRARGARDDGRAGRSAPPVRPPPPSVGDHRDADARAVRTDSPSPTGRSRSARPSGPQQPPVSESQAVETAAALDAGSRADPRRLHVAPARRPGDRRDRRPVWDDVEETLIAGDVGAALAMDVVERARRRRDAGRRRGRHPDGACGAARRRATLALGAALAGRRQPGRGPRGRRQRDGQDHDDRQARQPLHAREGRTRAPRRRRHLPRRRDRPAPDLGRSGRRAGRRPRSRRRSRAPSSTTPSTRPSRAARTSSSPTRPAASTRSRT